MTDRQMTRLLDTQQLTGTAAALVTVGASERLGVRRIRLHNIDTVSRIVTMYRNPDDGGGSPVAAAAANQLARITLPTKTSWQLDFQHLTLQTQGQAIFGFSDVASKVNITIDGVSTDDPTTDLRRFELMAASQFVANSIGTLITNALNERLTIREVIVHNVSAAAVLLELWRVPDAAASVGVAVDANQVYETFIPAFATVPIDAEWTLEDTNDTIQGLAGSASALVFSADGLFEDRS